MEFVIFNVLDRDANNDFDTVMKDAVTLDVANDERVADWATDFVEVMGRVVERDSDEDSEPIRVKELEGVPCDSDKETVMVVVS